MFKMFDKAKNRIAKIIMIKTKPTYQKARDFFQAVRT